MKNKKGFTLIELLAIIVILAMIAVITVPLVLNIIENSKKGATQNSALGYIDAVHKYYASRLAIDSNFSYADNTYEIVQNGYLSYEDSNDSSNDILYEIAVSGKVPSNGYVEILRNRVMSACIAYDEYAVLFTGGNISDTAKGTCLSATEIGETGEAALEVGTEYSMDPVNEVVKEQTLTITRTGYYKLEVWGASGSDLSYNSKTSKGGYGGYATGVMRLTAGTVLYINVGETGLPNNATEGNTVAGGYNGGGSNTTDYWGVAASAGGATHIALKSGVLSSLSNDINKILIVAGGGGAGGVEKTYRHTDGGQGGGYIGGNGVLYGDTEPAVGIGGSSTANTYFGYGASAGGWAGAGGGGFYGGSAGAGSGGGSGYIGNSKLIDGVMYCYGCGQNSTASIRTYSTTDPEGASDSCPDGYSESPISNCAKKGDGSVNITFLGTSYSHVTFVNDEFVFPYVKWGDDKEQTMIVPEDGYYKVEVWGASGGNSTGSYIGGYGGYSSGIVNLTKGTTLYVNVGGAGVGSGTTRAPGGYNGGGNGQGGYCNHNSPRQGASGGGATHIALKSGILSALDDYKGTLDTTNDVYRSDDILIVAGGGGGGFDYGGLGKGGSGGGATGVTATYTLGNHSYTQYATGGTQTVGGTSGNSYNQYSIYIAGSFGKGGDVNSDVCGEGSGGGGGFYGGGRAAYAPGAGGSGYIASTKLSDGVMYCYGCTESANTYTRTIDSNGSNRDANCTNGYSSSPLSNCSKSGNGYAKITYLGKTLN